MLLLPLPRKLIFHPTPLSVRQAHFGSTAQVMVLDGDMTFADFWPLFDGAQPGRTLTEPQARRWVRRLLRQSSSHTMQAQADDAWAVARVYDALTELRLAGVTASGLAHASEKLVELRGLLQAYESVLQEGDWCDAADRQRLAVYQVSQGELPPSLRAVERVEVLAGTELLGARLDVLRAFAARGVAVRVHMPWDEERPHAFAWTEGLLHALETRAHPSMAINFAPRHGRGALRPVVSALYASAPPLAPSQAGPQPVVVRRAPSGLRHAESVVGQVAAWRAQGVAAHAIAVVTPQLPMALDLVRALQGAGIGCAHNAQRSLSQSRIAQLFFAGVRSAPNKARGLFWTELWESCGTPLVTEDTTWSPGWVVRALRRAGLASARAWGLYAANPGGDDAMGDIDRAGAASSELMQALPAACAQALADALAVLCAPLWHMPMAGTWSALTPATQAWMHALTRAWGNSDAPAEAARVAVAEVGNGAETAALQAAVQGDAEAVIALRQCLLEAIQELPQEAPQNAIHDAIREAPDAACADAQDPWSRSQFADWLEALCGERSYLTTPRDPQGVQVLRPEDAVGGRFRCLVFAGADMEAFPRPLPTNPSLPEAARIEVNRLLGPRLMQYAPMLGRGALPAVARDMWLWIEVLATASEQVVVTLQEGLGEAMLGPSELVDELLRVSGVAMTSMSPDACVDAVAPAAWVPRLWADAPERFSAHMAQAAPAWAPRLTRRWRDAKLRPELAEVPQNIAQRLRAYLTQTVHSASRMDVLGMCAFRYVAAAVWGLGTDETLALGATPREQGSAAHAALHQVYRNIMHAGGLQQARLQPEATLEAAKQTIATFAGDILAETQVHPWLQPALLADTTHAALGQLQRDLKADTAHEPVALEYSFDDRNTAGPEALRVAHPTDGTHVQVRGSIDRVDATAAELWVLDYKRTVRARHPDRHFQLALYAAIALRDMRPDAAQVRLGWAGLRPAKIHWATDLPSAPAELLTHLRERLFARIDPVAAGQFSPDPDDPSTCERCDFRRLCRRDDNAALAAGAEPTSEEVPHGI